MITFSGTNFNSEYTNNFSTEVFNSSPIDFLDVVQGLYNNTLDSNDYIRVVYSKVYPSPLFGHIMNKNKFKKSGKLRRFNNLILKDKIRHTNMLR